MGIWGKWKDIHNDDGQDMRLQSAKQAKYTPVEIDIENSAGIFSSSNGVYKTTLESCDCLDFSIRDKPCKHMYRLAIELGLVNETAQTDPSKIKAPPPADSYTLEQLIKKTDDLPDDTQKLFQKILYQYIYHGFINIGIKNTPENQLLITRGILKEVNDYAALLRMFTRNRINTKLRKEKLGGFNLNMKHEDLIKWCCEFAQNLPLGDVIAVTLDEKTCHGKRKIYSYLIEKYRKDFSVDF